VCATAYLIIVLMAAGWAMYIDVTLRDSTQEHLAPDILLLIVTLPSSSAVAYLYDTGWTLFSGPIVQIVWITLCGLGQAWLLFALARMIVNDRFGRHHPVAPDGSRAKVDFRYKERK
jgi:hypothetical protein